MKAFLFAALAVLFACPANAEFNMSQAVIVCSANIEDFEEVHGKFKRFEIGDQNEEGFGVVFGVTDSYRVLFLLPPDGMLCAVWDKRIADGDPA